MSELQAYYEAFSSGCWACEDEDECPCRGSGWAVSQVDTCHRCPVHYRGQMSPQDEEYERMQVSLEVVGPAPLEPIWADEDIPF